MLSDKWYVRQMKLFKFMNCQASWTQDKLHGSLSANKKRPLRCIRPIDCAIKDFTKIVDEFRTEDIAFI